MNIKIEIKNIMSNVLNVDNADITEDLAIGDLPTWDSLNHLRIIAEIEDRFQIKFTPDVLMDLEDFSDIVSATKNMIE